MTGIDSLWCNSIFSETQEDSVNIDDSKAEKPKLNPLRLSSSSGDDHFDIENETLIGREVECTITLPSPHVSRYHAKINVSDSGLTIEDLNSANGTFVNGNRISEKTPISLGDELRFDDLVYRLTTEESGGSEATVVMSNKAVLEALQQKQKIDASPISADAGLRSPVSKPAPQPVPDDSQAEDDGTRILSQDQLQNAANIHQQSQSFTDSGSGPRFVATTAPIRGQIFQLAEPGPEKSWRLGRSRECEVCVSAPSVSRVHSIISKEDGRFHIRAENQSKPFLFNNLPQTSAMLKHNDHVQIGSIELVFRLDDAVQQPSSEQAQTEKRYSLKSIALIIMFAAAVAILFLLLPEPRDNTPPPNILPILNEAPPASQAPKPSDEPNKISN